jgi:glutamate dehydrogenase
LECGEVDELDTGSLKEIFQETFARVWRGEVENDGFNRLVLRARLPSSGVVRMRAYCKYLRQTSTTFSQAYIEDCLAAHPEIVRQLVALFDARFDPARTDRDA